MLGKFNFLILVPSSFTCPHQLVLLFGFMFSYSLLIIEHLIYARPQANYFYRKTNRKKNLVNETKKIW